MFAPVVEYYQGTGARRKTRPIATALGYSRQYYYKLRHQSFLRHQKEEQILALVKNERKILPVVGCRKLHGMIGGALLHKKIKCGRDKLFTLLGRHDMLIKPKRRYVQTTNSRHWLRKYPNIAKDALIDGPEQLWVSDITYIKTREGNCYLNLVTDAFSRKIVGYAINDNMETESMIKAYSNAIKEKQNQARPTIHHSDRGLQYCSKE